MAKIRMAEGTDFVEVECNEMAVVAQAVEVFYEFRARAALDATTAALDRAATEQARTRRITDALHVLLQHWVRTEGWK